MQMAAPRATINTVPSYGSSAGVGYFRPTSAFPTSIKGQVSLPGAHFWQKVLLNTLQTPLADTSLVAGSSVASRLVSFTRRRPGRLRAPWRPFANSLFSSISGEPP